MRDAPSGIPRGNDLPPASSFQSFGQMCLCVLRGDSIAALLHGHEHASQATSLEQV
jgi:hypothetical protein